LIRFAASRSLRNWGAAILALCAGVLLTPRPSEAGCGDYVWIRGRPVSMVHSIPDQPTNPDTDSTAGDIADHGAPHRPCHGPRCSDGSIPPVAPVPGAVVSVDQWAVSPRDALPNIVSCDNMLAEPLDLVAAGFRLSILRPPR